MQKPELISILLPVRNSSAFLRQCIESLLSQSYPHLEIIAVDDFSRDDSWKLLKAFRKQDKRVRIYRNVKVYGLSVTLNRALKKVRGKYLAFMDVTAYATKDRLKRQLAFLQQNPKVVAVGTQCMYYTDRKKKADQSAFPLTHEEITKTLVNGLTMQSESVLIDRYMLPKDVIKFGPEEAPLIYSKVLVKLLPYGQFANLQNILTYYYQNDEKPQPMKQHLLPHIKLWLQARFFYDHRPSLQSLFYPILKPQPSTR